MTDLNDIAVLRDLYFSLDGSQWTWTKANLVNAQIWNFTTNESNINPCGDAWYGITCSNNKTSNVTTVSAIELGGMNLQGTIPISINELKELSILNFTNNEITGTIPDINSTTLVTLVLYNNQLRASIPNFTMLPKLSYLDLGFNHLSGSIPNFANLPQLSYLNLEYQALSGSIPDFTNLPQLRYLNLGFNELLGSIPDFTNLPQLSYLGLHFSGLSESIPHFTNLPQLSHLDLGNNRFLGSIPDFTNLPHLNYLNLQFNQLSGSIPDFTNLPQLSYLDLNFNQLAGSIPDFTNLPQLSHLDVGINRLAGSIPDFTNLPQLNYLDLDTNKFLGSIPDFTNLPQLNHLDLSSNQLSGSIPDFTNLPQLSYLDLSKNDLLSGSIADFSKMPKLSYLDLYENKLSGSIPNFTNLPELSYLNLCDNKLSGSLPDFDNLPQLSYLNLGINQLLSGSIPDFSNLPKLSYLNLASNQRSGSIPNFANLPLLSQLYLGTNQLSGSIPNFSNLPVLSYLDLSNNKLHGPIPNFANLPLLSQLLLGTNQLSGSIPDFTNLPLLSYLDLDTNRLVGSIPDFTNLPQLSHLDLDTNRLSGSIPDFTNLRQLSDLNLDTNRLSGSIPDFTNLPELSNLYLEFNQLSGSIPFLANCPQLIQLLLSTNQLSGSISDLNFPTQLKALDVSENFLVGSLPSFDCPILIALIVRNNYLSGTVSFGDLKYLSTISLSGNLFSGQMNQTFNDISQNNFIIIDVSNNLFAGTIPKEIFQAPNIQIFSAGSNCIEGSIPSELCSASTLVALSLDGLGTAESCQDPLFPDSSTHTYQLKHPIQGSIPTCLFELPYLQVLHLSGNGLTGTIPENIQLSSDLIDLALSYNRLQGPFPNNIQAHHWEALDISVNKINGVVGQNLQFLVNESRYSFFVNRLSGSLPDSAFNQSVNIDILNGNMFDCAVMNGKNVLPESDPNHKSYSCGSQSINNSLIAWLCMYGCFFVVFVGCYLKVWDSSIVWIKQNINDFEEKLRLWWNTTNSETATSLSKEIAVDRMFILLRRVCVLLLSLLVFVLLPVYGSLWSFRTHTYSYVWIVSLGYLSGQLPAVILFFIILVWFIVCFVFLLYIHSLAIDVNTVISNVLHLNPQRSCWNLQLLKLIIIILNGTVVLATNIGYVYLSSLSLTKTQKTSLQVSIAVIKLIWSLTFIKRTFLSVMKQLNPNQEDTSIFGIVQFLSLLNIFNFILAPMIAAAFFDSNCFKNAIFTPSKVQTSFSAIYYDAEVDKEYSASLSYSPPFIYNYQCTSSLLAEFVTVFVYKYTVSNFFTIILSFYLIFILKYRFFSEFLVAPFLPKQVRFTMEKLKKENLLWTPFARVERKILEYTSFLRTRDDENEIKCFDGDKVIIGVVGDFSVLLTFGIAFPPLGVIICFSICLHTIYHQLLLGRLMNELEESIEKNNSIIAEAIEKGREEENVVNKVEEPQDLAKRFLKVLKKKASPLWSYFQPSIKYLGIFSAIFLSFFLFDILGDEVGIGGAIWIIPVTSCLPLFLVIIHQLGMTVYKKCRQRRVKGNYVIPVSENEEDIEGNAHIEDHYIDNSFDRKAEDK